MEYTGEDITKLEKQLLKEYNRMYYKKRRNDPNYKKYQREKQKQYYEKKYNKETKKEIMMNNIIKSNVIVKFEYDNLILEI